MKSLFLPGLAMALGFSFLPAQPLVAKDNANITKNEAEHLALKSHKGARVTSAELRTVEGNLVWLIEITGRKGKRITHVTVDAMSGHILSQRREHR